MGDSNSTLALPMEPLPLPLPLQEKVEGLNAWHTLQNPGLGVGFTEKEKSQWWKSKDYKYRIGTVRSVDLDKIITIYTETFDMSKKHKKSGLAASKPYVLTEGNIERIVHATGINVSGDEQVIEGNLDTMKIATDFEDLYLGWLNDTKDSVMKKEIMKTLFRFVFGKKTINDKNKAERFYAHLRFAYTQFNPEEKVPCRTNPISEDFRASLEYRLEGVKKEISAAIQTGLPKEGVYVRKLFALEKGLLKMINYLDSKSGCFEYGQYSEDAKNSDSQETDEVFARALMVAQQLIDSDEASSSTEDSLRKKFSEKAPKNASKILEEIQASLAKHVEGDDITGELDAATAKVKRLEAEVARLTAAVGAGVAAAGAAAAAAARDAEAARVRAEAARVAAEAAAAEALRLATTASREAAEAARVAADAAREAARVAAEAAEARLANARDAEARVTADLVAARQALQAAQAERDSLRINDISKLKKTILVLTFSLIRSRRAFELLSSQMDESGEIELERIKREVELKIAGIPAESQGLVRRIFDFLIYPGPRQIHSIDEIQDLYKRKREAEEIINLARRLPFGSPAIESIQAAIQSIENSVDQLRKKLEAEQAELLAKLRGLRESLALSRDSSDATTKELAKTQAELEKCRAALDECNKIKGEQAVSISVLEGKIEALGLTKANKEEIDKRLSDFSAALTAALGDTERITKIKREFSASLAEDVAAEAKAAEEEKAEAAAAAKAASDKEKADSAAAIAASIARAEAAEAAAKAAEDAAKAAEAAAKAAEAVAKEEAAVKTAQADAKAATSVEEREALGTALKEAASRAEAAEAEAASSKRQAAALAEEKAAAEQRAATESEKVANAENRAAASAREKAEADAALREASARVTSAEDRIIVAAREEADRAAATAAAFAADKDAAAAAFADASAKEKVVAAAALKEATDKATEAEARAKAAANAANDRLAAVTAAASADKESAAAQLAKAKALFEAANEEVIRSQGAIKERDEMAVKARAAEAALKEAKAAAADADARVLEVGNLATATQAIHGLAMERHSAILKENEELIKIIIDFIQTFNKEFSSTDAESIREELSKFSEMNPDAAKRVEAALAIIDAIDPHVTDEANPMRQIERVLRNVPAPSGASPAHAPAPSGASPAPNSPPALEPPAPSSPSGASPAPNSPPALEPPAPQPNVLEEYNNKSVESFGQTQSIQESNDEMIEEIQKAESSPEIRVKIFKFILQQLQLFASRGSLGKYVPLVTDTAHKYSYFIDNYYKENKIKNPKFKTQVTRGLILPEYLVSDGKTFWDYIINLSDKKKAVQILLDRINDIIREYSRDITVIVKRDATFPVNFTEELSNRLIYLLNRSFESVGITNKQKQQQVKEIITNKIKPIILSIATEVTEVNTTQKGGAKANNLCDLILSSMLLKLDGPEFNYQALIDKAGRTLDDIGQCDLILEMLNHLVDEHCLIKRMDGYTFSSVYMDLDQARALVEAFNNNFTEAEKQRFYEISSGVFNYRVPDEQTILGKHPFFLVGNPSSAEDTPLYGVIDDEITLTVEERSMLEEGSMPIGAILFLYIVCFRECQGDKSNLPGPNRVP